VAGTKGLERLHADSSRLFWQEETSAVLLKLVSLYGKEAFEMLSLIVHHDHSANFLENPWKEMFIYQHEQHMRA